ncbi:uncharacterized protein LOC123677129 [Harmonia axyridis]|uniref:uncharacterized protein LOC123677129 n=1 Tax=Harmonia axyridis TaxID=115357 RepID=UPI001E276A7B|nr:uncharacterized protein LOC123677129 [Harmonia axyridis]
MGFQLPRTDINFLNSVRYYTTYLFILPNFNLSENRIEIPTFFKPFSAILSTLYIGLYIYCVSLEYENSLENATWITKAIIFIIDFSSIAIFCVALFSILKRKKSWEKLFKSLRLFDSLLQNKRKDYKSSTCSFFFKFLSSHLIILLFYISFVCYVKFFTKHFSWFYVLSMISSIYLFSTSIIIAELAYAIVIRYTLIFDLISRSDLKEDSLSVSKKIEKGRVFFEINGHIVNLFNKVFGWHILIIQCRTIAAILRNLDLLVDGFSWKIDNQIAHLTMSVVLVYGTSMLAMRCDAAKEEAEKIFYRSRVKYFNARRDTEEFKLLENLFDTVKNQPQFTAAGFFEIEP